MLDHTSFEMHTSKLPVALKALVKLTRLRPTIVKVRVANTPTTFNEGYATSRVVSLGEETHSEDTSYTGSDGEPNRMTTRTFSAPAAYVHGFGKKKTVCIVVGNVPTDMIRTMFNEVLAAELRYGVLHNTALLSVAVDAALECGK